MNLLYFKSFLEFFLTFLEIPGIFGVSWSFLELFGASWNFWRFLEFSGVSGCSNIFLEYFPGVSKSFLNEFRDLRFLKVP